MTLGHLNNINICPYLNYGAICLWRAYCCGHLTPCDFTLISLYLICFHLMSLDFTLLHLIPQGKRERPVGQKGKGKGTVAATFGAWISLGIQTARARTHDTKRFPGWTHTPTSDLPQFNQFHAFQFLKVFCRVPLYARAGGLHRARLCVGGHAPACERIIFLSTANSNINEADSALGR